MTENSSPSTKKLLILGLDNSGKSSILLTFKGNTNLLSFLSLKPTKNVSIDNIKSEEYAINVWDFGGQYQYRKEYLKDFRKYLEGVNRVIYVIDVQDFDKYPEALKYFKAILEELKKESKSIDLSVFLHKYDPYLVNQEKFKDIDDILDKELIKKIRSLIPEDCPHEIYKTSIFTTFKKILVP